VSEAPPLVPDWSLVLPFPMARRVEDGSLVFWHSPRGLTFWLNAYNASDPDDALAEWQEIHASAAYDLIEARETGFIRFAYVSPIASMKARTTRASLPSTASPVPVVAGRFTSPAISMIQACSMSCSRPGAACASARPCNRRKHFRAKWTPVRVKKMR
jgi:hypothetical protein